MEQSITNQYQTFMKARLLIIFCALFSVYSVAADSSPRASVKIIDQIWTTRTQEAPTVVQFRYNKQGLVICQKSHGEWTDTPWDGHDRYDMSYDEQGNNVEKIYSVSCSGHKNGHIECWKYHSKFVNSYDNLNQLLTTTKYSWVESSGSWQLNSKIDFAYLDSDIVSEIEQTWDASTDKYTPVRKMEQGWNQDRTKQTTSYFLWKNNSWVKDSEDTTYFDQEEKIIKLERKGCTNGVLYSIIDYLYDDNNLLVEKTERSDYLGSLSRKTEYTYSAEKLVREVQCYLIDDVWCNDTKIEYRYDADGDILYKERSEWDFDRISCDIEPCENSEYTWIFEVDEEYKYARFNIYTEQAGAASSPSVVVYNGYAIVQGLTEPCMVALYTISGMRLASVQSEDEASFALPQRGIYLIEINSGQGGETLKVLY